MSIDNFPDWQSFEKEANEALGIEATVSSGRVWYDKNDGTSRGHVLDNPIRIDADEKSTKHRTYSISVDFMEANRKRSGLAGKTFVLPVRFELEDGNHDFIVMSLKDFTAMSGLDEVGRAKQLSDQANRKMRSAKEKVLALQDKIADKADVIGDVHMQAWLYDVIDALDAIDFTIDKE